MKRRKINNRGQLKISFGLIFTIIIIIFFLSFAALSIRKSVVHKDEIAAGQFIHDLRVDIQETGSHEQALIEVDYKVPEGVTQIYFEPPEEDDDGNIIETDNPNVHFNHEDYPGGTINGINWGYSDDKEKSDEEEEPVVPEPNEEEEVKKPLIFNISEDGHVRFYLIKEYDVEDVIVDLDGIFELPRREFHVGEPQNHGTYNDIMAKGASGEYKVLFNINFENRPYLGKYETYSEFKSDWNGARWGNRGEEAEIVLDPADTSNKAMLITFPFWDPSENETWVCWDGGTGPCGDSEGKRVLQTTEPTHTRSRALLDNVGTGSGGMSITIPLKGKYDEVYLSYNIKYEPDWAAPAGGKLPGFKPDNACPACAPTDCQDAAGNRYHYEWVDMGDHSEWVYEEIPDRIADDFSARHMFHSNDHISYYYYDYDKVHKCGDSGSVRDSMIFDGDWHNIVFRLRLNDPGVDNGVMETWIDGENHGHTSGHLFRTVGSDFGISFIAFSNFFGGSGMPCDTIKDSFASSCARGEWWPHLDSWVRSCAVEPDNPCSDYRKFADGSPQSYWGNRKTEYIHFDDIIAYIPY
jgi:polysaccharide lyase-like protein